MKRDTPTGALIRSIARLVSACALLVEALASRVGAGAPPLLKESREAPPQVKAGLPPEDDLLIAALRKLGYPLQEARGMAAHAVGDTLPERVSSALSQTLRRVS